MAKGVPESATCGIFGLLGGRGLHFRGEEDKRSGEASECEVVAEVLGQNVHVAIIIIN
jgi:hypothetical protein